MNKKRVFVSLLLVCGFFGAGCQSAPAKHYAIRAEVISVDEPKGLIMVKHGEIPGLMPAMTMSYAVADPIELHKVEAGDIITADLVVSENKGRLEKIIVVEKHAAIPTARSAKPQ